MFKKILILIAVLAIGLLVYVGLQSPDFRIAREVQIHAPADLIFAHINDPRKFEEWDPFTKADPNNKMTYSGPNSGVGATAAWDGNNQVGAGQSQITESTPGKRVHMHLIYTRPFENTSEGEFTLLSEGDNTRVTWSNSGKNIFIARLVCIFMNMDHLIGGTFEKGLTDLKNLAEKEAQMPAAAAPSK